MATLASLSSRAVTVLSPEHILQTGFGVYPSRLLLSAIELGLFTELGKGPRLLSQLQRALGVGGRAIRPFLDALVALGFLQREGRDATAVYLNSREAGHFLDRHANTYIGHLLGEADARCRSDAQHLAAALRTDDEFAVIGCVTAHAEGVVATSGLLLAERVNFSACVSLLDLGGACQPLIRQLAKCHPHLQCSNLVLGDRAEDHLPPLPSADVIVVGPWVDAWEPPRRRELIARSHDSLGSDGCLIVAKLLNDVEGSRHASGLLMAALSTAAREAPASFTSALGGAEFEAASRSAGFTHTQCIPLAWPMGAMLAFKARGG